MGIVTGYGLDGPEIESRWGARYSPHAQTGRGAHPASYTVGTEALQGVERPGHGVDHSPLLALRVMKGWICSWDIT